MNLRFRILEPGNTGAPDYTICGQAASSVNFVNLTLKVTVDGTVVINTTDLDSYVFPGSVVTVANGITVDQMSIEDSEYIAMRIGLAEVWDATSVQIEISKTGYIGYANVFQVYGYDLGNNPNQTYSDASAITDNPDFTLYLLNETNNVVNGKQTKAFASFITYRRPLTNEVYFYKSNGGVYKNEYSDEDGNVILVSPNGLVCNPNTDSYKIKSDIVDGSTVVSSCVSSLIEVVARKYIIDFDVSVNCQQTGQLTASDIGMSVGTVDCTMNLATNTAVANMDFADLETVYVDDTIEYPYDTQRIKYELFDYGGVLQASKVVELSINPPPYLYDSNDLNNAIQFDIDQPGDYILKVTLGIKLDETLNIAECYQTVPIHNSNFYEIEESIDCGKYTVYNRSFEDLTLEVSQMQSDKTFKVISTVVVPKLASQVVTHSTDDIYQYNIKRTLTQNNAYGIIVDSEVEYDYIFIVASYCNLKNCIFEYINKLVCKSPETICDCKAEDFYNFNALMLQVWTYFGTLNEEYNFNYLYEALTPNKLDELYDIKGFLDRFENYCDDCTLHNEDCGCS